MPSTIHTAHQQYNAQPSNYNWWVYLLYLWRGHMPSQVCSSCTTSALLEDQIQTRKTLTLCSLCETCNIGKSSILLLLNIIIHHLLWQVTNTKLSAYSHTPYPFFSIYFHMNSKFTWIHNKGMVHGEVKLLMWERSGRKIQEEKQSRQKDKPQTQTKCTLSVWVWEKQSEWASEWIGFSYKHIIGYLGYKSFQSIQSITDNLTRTTK